MKKKIILLSLISFLSSCNNRNEDFKEYSNTEYSGQENNSSSSRIGNYYGYVLTHPKLITNNNVPDFVYRVDSRTPDNIFNNGFTARGISYRLTDHVRGGSNLSQSGYIATTGSRETAVLISNSSINDSWGNAISIDNTGRSQHRTWIYVIRSTPSNFISVNSNLPRCPYYDRYRGQNEWVAVDRIYAYDIERAIPVTRFFRNGSPDGPAIYGEGQQRQNNRYNVNGTPYRPLRFENVDVGDTYRSSNGNCN